MSKFKDIFISKKDKEKEKDPESPTKINDDSSL